MRVARPVPVAASSELELDADDILESNDIDIGTPEIAAEDVLVAEAASNDVSLAEAAADDVVGAAEAAARQEGESLEPAPAQVSSGIDPDATNVLPRSAASAVAAAATLVGMEASAALAVPAAPAPTPAALAALFVPPPPHTSPLPLESVIVAEPSEAGEPAAERTQEMRRDALTKVAAAAARLDAVAPEQTEVLVRSAMPAALQAPQANTAFAATTPAWSQGRSAGSEHLRAAQPASPRPSSIAPVAVDALPPHMMMRPMPAVQPASNKQGLLIGGLAFAAVALIGLVGVGGYVASRTLSAKADAVALSTPVESAPAVESGAGAGSFTQGASAPATPAAPVAAAQAEPAPSVSEPTPTPSAPGIDIASLPSAPAPVAAAPASPAAQHAAVSSNGGASGARSTAPAPAQVSGRTSSAAAGPALPPPGGAAPLPPPAAAPAAPAAAATGTGVVRVDPSLRAVVVDGSYRRANDGVVTVSCGPHRIKAGMKEAQSVNVPCGGAVSL
jgi:hypothetical protein